jgi:hypothetical protein
MSALRAGILDRSADAGSVGHVGSTNSVVEDPAPNKVLLPICPRQPQPLHDLPAWPYNMRSDLCIGPA